VRERERCKKGKEIKCANAILRGDVPCVAHCIYLTEPEIKDTTDIAISIPYTDLHNATDDKGWLRTKR
jgi:hypothetical protein